MSVGGVAGTVSGLFCGHMAGTFHTLYRHLQVCEPPHHDHCVLLSNECHACLQYLHFKGRPVNMQLPLQLKLSAVWPFTCACNPIPSLL